MQVAFYFAGEITQVLDAIPWVRCASGNVSRDKDTLWTELFELSQLFELSELFQFSKIF